MATFWQLPCLCLTRILRTIFLKLSARNSRIWNEVNPKHNISIEGNCVFRIAVLTSVHSTILGNLLWCGFSDMIDGPIARKINAASELVSKIDSIADIVFVICAAIRILPSITLPSWIRIWMAGIGVVKLAGICVNSRCHGHFFIKHSSLNKLTGFLLFCLPFAIVAFTPVALAVVICTVASISTVADFS